MSSLGRVGALLSFEGIDASGKTTQSRMLFSWLRSKGARVEYLSFPDYTTNIGEEIRAFLSRKRTYTLEARHILFSANRYEHMKQIVDWLQDKRIVIVNRYCESGIAYGVAAGLPFSWLEGLESQMPQSDYVFYLDATPEISKKRKETDRDMFESDPDYLSRVSKVYNALSERKNWFRIGAENSIETVHYEIKRLVENLFLGEVERKENSKSEVG